MAASFRPKDQYTSEAYHELLIRWFEYGAFCPIFRVHGYQSEADIRNYGQHVEDILRQYDDLRYRLMPYIYSAAWRVTKNGETLIRSLPLEFSSDKLASQISDQFMFGEALLINPVTTEGAKKRTLYLPAGQDWIDFWTGKRDVAVRASMLKPHLTGFPFYARAGSIIPFGPHAESTSAKQNPIELRIYAGAPGKFTLYEDQGDNYDYERGAYAEIPIQWDDTAARLTIGNRRGRFPGMLDRRTFRVVVVKNERGTGVASTSEPDATIDYAGKTTSVNVRSRP